MLRSILVPLATSLLALAASAQCTLTVTGTGAPGTPVVISLDGSTPNAYAFLVVGDTAGPTTLNLGPLGTLTLGVAQPFLPLPLGRTDASGDASVTINVPAGNIPGVDLVAQGVTAAFTLAPTPSVTFCTTNVVSFHLGS